MSGNYTAYRYNFNNYLYMSAYASFSEDDVTGKMMLTRPNIFLDQQLVNRNVLPTGFHRLLNVEKDGSMVAFGYDSNQLSLKRYNAEGETCPAYETPVFDTSREMKTFTISRISLKRGVDIITSLNDYNVAVSDTAVIMLTCPGLL